MSGWDGFWIGLAIVAAVETYVEFLQWKYKLENNIVDKDGRFLLRNFGVGKSEI